MNEKSNKNANVEQLTKMFLSREEEKVLIVKYPLKFCLRPVYKSACSHVYINIHVKHLINYSQFYLDNPTIQVG